MNKKGLIRKLLSILLAAAFLLPAFEANAADWPYGGKVGERAPLFSLKDLEGNEVYLSTFKGRPVFLNFWATWCPYCVKERAELNALFAKYKGTDLVIISVSLDRTEKKLRDFMKDNPADYTVLTDTKMKTAAMYGVRGFPTTFLIGRDGNVKYRMSGARQWSSKPNIDTINNLIELN